MKEFKYEFPNNGIDPGEARLKINNPGVWREFTGSDEQIAEIHKAEHGFIFRYKGSSANITEVDSEDFCSWLQLKEWLSRFKNITEILICNPHPLADMIIRQAQTGQPVWIRLTYEQWSTDGSKLEKKFVHVSCTTKPNWKLENAEYSFTPFDEVEK